MAKQSSKPHILAASSNVRRMKTQLAGVLSGTALDAIEAAITENVVALYRLGKSHYFFGKRQPKRAVSRMYYGAHNWRRAVSLAHDGSYSKETADHKTGLPDNFPHKARFDARIRDLREDRNLADYDHIRSLPDLIYSPEDHAILLEGQLNEQ